MNKPGMDIDCFYSGKCLSDSLCLMKCVLSYDFITPKIERELNSTVYSYDKGKKRDREIIRILEKKRPPRVNDRQVNWYYNHLRKTGDDPDKPDNDINSTPYLE